MLKNFEVVCKIKRYLTSKSHNKKIIVRIADYSRESLEEKLRSPFIDVISIYDVPDKRFEYLRKHNRIFTIL